MNRRTPSSSLPDEWPLQLRLLILAAQRECPAGHAGALRDLISLAVTKVPARGILDPTSRGEHDLFVAIDAIANRHLGLSAARAAWRRAIRGAGLELEVRDRLDHAAQQLQGVSDIAYFYAGLAFGLTCVSLYRHGG
jgi:hypothetical protein